MFDLESRSNSHRVVTMSPPIESASTMNCHFVMLVDECVIQLLTYLRAVDIASCSEVNKAMFTKFRIKTAIKFQLQYIYYPLMSSLSPTLSNASLSLSSSSASSSPLASGNKNCSTASLVDVNDADCRCDFLYTKEIKLITASLNYSQSQLTKGYWVSTTWLSNTKKFYEALSLPQILSEDVSTKIGKKNCPKNKKAKIRQRRGSDVSYFKNMLLEIIT